MQETGFCKKIIGTLKNVPFFNTYFYVFILSDLICSCKAKYCNKKSAKLAD